MNFFAQLLLLAGLAGASVIAGTAPAPAAASASAAANSFDLRPDPLTDALRLKPMDKLLFSIAEDPRPGPPLTLMVSPLRRLVVPVGRDSSQSVEVAVANKTLGQVKAEIAKLLNTTYYYNAHFQLTLESTAPRQGQVLFNGEGVRNHQLDIDPTDPPHIYEASLKVGVTDDANLKKVVINRLDPVTHKQLLIKVNLVEAEKDRSKDPPLQDGDRVTINTKIFNFH